jgi:hypothetical protein
MGDDPRFKAVLKIIPPAASASERVEKNRSLALAAGEFETSSR